jgi:hypothetical protein
VDKVISWLGFFVGQGLAVPDLGFLGKPKSAGGYGAFCDLNRESLRCLPRRLFRGNRQGQMDDTWTKWTISGQKRGRAKGLERRFQECEAAK